MSRFVVLALAVIAFVFAATPVDSAATGGELYLKFDSTIAALTGNNTNLDMAVKTLLAEYSADAVDAREPTSRFTIVSKEDVAAVPKGDTPSYGIVSSIRVRVNPLDGAVAGADYEALYARYLNLNVVKNTKFTNAWKEDALAAKIVDGGVQQPCADGLVKPNCQLRTQRGIKNSAGVKYTIIGLIAIVSYVAFLAFFVFFIFRATGATFAVPTEQNSK